MVMMLTLYMASRTMGRCFSFSYLYFIMNFWIIQTLSNSKK